MPKPERSGAELQEIVDAKLRADLELAEDGEIRVPLPQRTALNEGCNWNMDVFGNARGRMAAIGRIVEGVRAEYNLR